MKLVPFCIVLLFTVPTAAAQNAVHVPFQAPPDGESFVPDEIIVVFDVGLKHTLEVILATANRVQVNDVSVQSILDELKAERFRRQFPSARPPTPGSSLVDLTGYYKVKLPTHGVDLEEALAAFSAHPGVHHVEKIGIHFIHATPNDTYYDDPPPEFPYDQWHYWGTNGIDADLAWDQEAGDSNVVVAILDSGVRYFHVDLGGPNALWGPDAPQTNGNIWINSGETANDGIDDDGNGFVDDTIGWDFVSSGSGAGVTCLDQDCSGVDNDPDDGDGHGTHVSGTVGAITNNSRSGGGVAGGFSDGTTSGTGNGIKIMTLRIGFHGRLMGVVGGLVRMDWAAEAMNYVSMQVDAGVNITAVNCSWGSSDTGGLGAAVTNLLAHDVMIIHAAGNSNSSSADFLGARDGVLNVAATDSNGAGALFTNHGSWVDLAAPGVDILSTYADPTDSDLSHHYIAVLSGTSMSAPHACGVAALLESFSPSLSGPDKFTLMVTTTTPASDVRDLGSGILNAKNAIDGVNQVGIGHDFKQPPIGVSIRVHPNPMRLGTRIVIDSPDGGSAAVSIVDLNGRLVQGLESRFLGQGSNELRWDGRDSRGRLVGEGIYFLIIRTGGVVAAHKIVVLR